VYQETSFRCGLAYIIAIVAEFDEYSNDILNLHEGSCLPSQAQISKDIGELSGGGCSSKV